MVLFSSKSLLFLPLQLRLLLIALATAASTPSSSLAGVQAVAGSAPPEKMETITVVATRTERSLDDVAATVSVISAEDIDRELTRDIADLVRFEPGVTVDGTGSRFGLGGFNIRGIGGNRVLTIVDGVRVPEEFSFGPFLDAGRDFVDVDSLERAEIARGPISSLYGSDALGGVVVLTTKGPQSYLAEDKKTHASFKAGYSSADHSTVGGLTLAAGTERLSGLVLYSHRDGSESETHGGVGGIGALRERADPQSTNTDNVVAKLQFSPADSHSFIAMIDFLDADTNTRVLSDYGLLSRGTLVNSRDAEDTRKRTRWSLGYAYEGESFFADAIQASIYQQNSKTRQVTFENRTTPSQLEQNRVRDSRFDQDIDGLFAQFTKGFEVRTSRHLVSYGIDFYRTDSEGLRTGSTVGSDGVSVPEFFPFPTRDFPVTRVKQFAAFLQDEIALFEGRLLLSPGLRFDSFGANAKPDEIYLSGNPGSPIPEDYDDSEVTAKIGAVYDLTPNVSVYGRFSEGFRAPPYDDVNVGFTNFIGGYKTISNASLESERSVGLEAGVRYNTDRVSLSLAGFHNDYDNFIEPLAIAPAFLSGGGIDPTDGLLTFQSVNRDKVEIEGVELSGEVSLDLLSPQLSGLSMRFALAWADGEDKSSGEPLNSVEPLGAVLGLGYEASSGRWGGQVVWTLAKQKAANDIDSTSGRLASDGYGVVDLLAHLKLSERADLNVGLFNLGDKRYIRWTDTIGIGGDAPNRFSQPGFNAAVNLRVDL